MIAESRLYLSSNFSELANDLLQSEVIFPLYSCKVLLLDMTNPCIRIQREYDADSLMITTSFSPRLSTATLPTKFAHKSLELLLWMISLAAKKEPILEENEPLENCGFAKICFKDLKIKYRDDSASDKYKDQ